MLKREHPHQEEAVRQVMFILTERCNLNCIYCYEKRKNQSANTLSARFIMDTIRHEMLAESEWRGFQFIFFGGEPLLEFETICEVVDWFASTAWPSPAKLCTFMVETNGTLLDDRMNKWFTAHRELVTVSLSLDGTKEAHDRNRCNSYDAVARHLDFFRQNWPEHPVKMTIGPDTLDQVYDGVIHIHDLGLRVEFDVIFENVWGDADSERRAVRSWAEQLDRLVFFYHARPELSRPKVLRRELDELFGRTTARRSAFCGAGKGVTCYAADGKQYPCFRFAPFIVDQPLFDVFSTPNVENAQCKECAFVKICSTCEGHNYAVTGSCFNRTSFHCRFFKASLLASARLLLLDHPEDLREPPEGRSKEDQMARMRRLLAIRVVDELCGAAVGG